MTTVITFGTFDLFHFGHLRMLERAAEHGNRLVVGVSSDMLNWSKKQQRPAVDQEQRMAIVRALACVDSVFLEESLEDKPLYCKKYGADVLVMGDDHLGEYDEMCKGVCKVHYLPRTKGVSSTKLKRDISSNSLASLCSAASSPILGAMPRSMSNMSLNSLDGGIDGAGDGGTGGGPARVVTPPHIPRQKLGIARPRNSDSPPRSKDGCPPRPPAQTTEADTAKYSAGAKNLVRSTTQSNPVTELLVTAHDAYYDFVMRSCTPFCAAMPRDISICGKRVTIFTANIVTYARGLLVVPIVLGMKYNYLFAAAFLVMFHDFLDHLDGVVAKQQARDGRSKGDDGAFGAFVDAQMDKFVFCLCLWSFLILIDYGTGSTLVNIVVVLTSIVLFALELSIAAVRTVDYFEAKHSPEGRPALRAVSEGKLKQKFESVGIALYCLALPNNTNIGWVVAGTVCLCFAVYFSLQSLAHKLRARRANLKAQG